MPFFHICMLIFTLIWVVQMEGIPSKARTLRMNLTMGKLYRISRNNRASSTCYKECLRSNHWQYYIYFKSLIYVLFIWKFWVLNFLKKRGKHSWSVDFHLFGPTDKWLLRVMLVFYGHFKLKLGCQQFQFHVLENRTIMSDFCC